jgi:hypothetical protein
VNILKADCSVDTLKVGSIGRDVTDGTYMLVQGVEVSLACSSPAFQDLF